MIFTKKTRDYHLILAIHAHAIEMAIDKNSKKDNIRHGEAVGIGMLVKYTMKKKKENI